MARHVLQYFYLFKKTKKKHRNAENKGFGSEHSAIELQGHGPAETSSPSLPQRRFERRTSRDFHPITFFSKLNVYKPFRLNTVGLSSPRYPVPVPGTRTRTRVGPGALPSLALVKGLGRLRSRVQASMGRAPFKAVSGCRHAIRGPAQESMASESNQQMSGPGSEHKGRYSHGARPASYTSGALSSACIFRPSCYLLAASPPNRRLTASTFYHGNSFLNVLPGKLERIVKCGVSV